jgi:hypothetical protein
MIDWDETILRLGVTIKNVTQKKKVILKCDECGIIKEADYKQAKRSMRKGFTLCISCAAKKSRQLFKDNYDKSDIDRSKSLSETYLKKWQDKSYKESQLRVINQDKARCSRVAKELWKNNDYRNKVVNKVKSNYSDPEFRKKMDSIYNSEEYREKLQDHWKDNEYRSKMLSVWEDERFYNDFVKQCSKFSKELWRRPGHKEKMLKILNSAKHREKMVDIQLKNPGKLSPLQYRLYQILSAMGINYYEEGYKTKIGYYVFDCIIPKQDKMKKNIAIECHGEFVHHRPGKRKKDKAKETYLLSYFGDQYDLKVLWGRWFLFRGKIESLISEWMDNKIEYEQIDFSFNDIMIREDITYKDATKFLSEYHYLYTCPRGSKYFGAFLEDKMVAIGLFSPLIRQNIVIGNFVRSDVLEISRFCIHPNYHKKNFASWFLSRCMRRVECKVVIAYADKTIGHDGTIYKASGFSLDRIVKPDYWYIDDKGFVMHKRTLYGYASRNSMRESDYAEKYNYSKIYGDEKYRYVKIL